MVGRQIPLARETLAIGRLLRLADAVRDRRLDRAAVLGERCGDPGATCDGREACDAQHPARRRPIFLGDTVDADESRRPATPPRRECRHHRHPGIVAMHDVGPPGAEGVAQSARRLRHAPEPAAEERQRELAHPELRRQRAGRRRERDLVPGRACPLPERDDDALRAAGPHLLDHVEDSHSSS